MQGVGFRPFIFRLATQLGLQGWVNNSPQGVFIEAEGRPSSLDTFLLRIERDKPPRASIQSMEVSYLDPLGFNSFEIRPSATSGEVIALVLPDIATCPECLAEIFDPNNRRYRYPFTNCTNCGPRFTIIESLPYDRPNTSMKGFPMCDRCRREYEDPHDRRFHAQPNACEQCGPHLELWDGDGTLLFSHHDALEHCARVVRDGGIVAMKGLGGFHLIADARSVEAVSRLRARKHREEKPFAVMVRSVEDARRHCSVSPLEERLLRSPESPIILLQRLRDDMHPQDQITPDVAPGNPYLGVMAPYTPLHHLLMNELGFPIVATSGNISDEPICIDERDALSRLHGIADAFLVHNRPIIRHADDSIVRIVLGRELVLRRARGFAPLPVTLRSPTRSMLAVGAHLKNAVAVAKGTNVFISQHIGDLETEQSFDAFRRAIDSLNSLFQVEPARVVSDLHPDYLSTKHAHRIAGDCLGVQHHYAHDAACMAENELDGRVLGVVWDGTGYGPDGTVWGGEFLLTDESSFRRVATFRPFRLPGGEQAIREPRRSAYGLVHAMFGEGPGELTDLAIPTAFTKGEQEILRRMVEQGINSPMTTSAGRLFDAIASLLDLRQVNTFEGQAAMAMEFVATQAGTDEEYPLKISGNGKRIADDRLQISDDGSLMIIDWAPMVLGILGDRKHHVPAGAIAAKFHNTLAAVILEVARKVGEHRVVLTGGCFQNKYLTERAVQLLGADGFAVYWHQRVPPNDGGIALGQIYAALRSERRENEQTDRTPEEQVQTTDIISGRKEDQSESSDG